MMADLHLAGPLHGVAVTSSDVPTTVAADFPFGRPRMACRRTSCSPYVTHSRAHKGGCVCCHCYTAISAAVCIGRYSAAAVAAIFFNGNPHVAFRLMWLKHFKLLIEIKLEASVEAYWPPIRSALDRIISAPPSTA